MVVTAECRYAGDVSASSAVRTVFHAGSNSARTALDMNDTLIHVENVSKRFCRSLKRSLWYGVQDLGYDSSVVVRAGIVICVRANSGR